MQTSSLAVCDMQLFNGEGRNFWMGTLSSLADMAPQLINPHKLDLYMILYADNAVGQIHLDNELIQLDGSKVIIGKPGCVISLKIDRNASGKLLCFTEDFFSLRYNNNILSQFSFMQRGVSPYLHLEPAKQKNWETILELTENEATVYSESSSKVLRSYLNILLFELERSFPIVNKALPKKRYSEKVRKFEELVNEHFVNKKLPSAYAEMLNVTANYLNKLCREETGLTAGDLIRKRIIIEAQRMLHYTHDTVSEIGDKLGFGSTSYFVTFFKHGTGTTPEQFRKSSN